MRCAKQLDGGDGVCDDVVAVNHLYQKNCGQRSTEHSSSDTDVVHLYRNNSVTGGIDMLGVNIGHFVFAQI